MAIGDTIRERLLSLGMNETELARRSGVSQPTINDLVNGKSKSSKFLPEIARALEMDLSELDPRVKALTAKPTPNFLGERDLKVFAAAEGGPGEMVVSTDPIELVPRPWYLGEVKEGFAVVVVGESMEPVFRPGSVRIRTNGPLAARLKMALLEDRTFWLRDIWPPFCDGLAGGLHVREHAHRRSGSRKELARVGIKRDADRLIRRRPLINDVLIEQPERGSRLVVANDGRQRFPLRVSEHEGAAPQLIGLVDSAQEKVRRESNLDAVDFERGENLAGQNLRVRQFDRGRHLAEFQNVVSIGLVRQRFKIVIRQLVADKICFLFKSLLVDRTLLKRDGNGGSCLLVLHEAGDGPVFASLQNRAPAALGGAHEIRQISDRNLRVRDLFVGLLRFHGKSPR